MQICLLIWICCGDENIVDPDQVALRFKAQIKTAADIKWRKHFSFLCGNFFTLGKNRCLSFIVNHYTTLTNFSMKYLVVCKVYTDVGGIK